MATATGAYPVRFDVVYPEHLGRGLIFVKWLLAFPHYLIVWALGSLQGVLAFIAFFAILFTRQYPRGLFDLYVNSARWSANLGAYIGLMRDEYPPFNWERGAYPVTLEIDYPEQPLSRWLIFVKWFLAIPHWIVLAVLGFAAAVAFLIAWFGILFTAQFPRGLFDFSVGVSRWAYRVTAYTAFLRDEYPPFSLAP